MNTNDTVGKIADKLAEKAEEKMKKILNPNNIINKIKSYIFNIPFIGWFLEILFDIFGDLFGGLFSSGDKTTTKTTASSAQQVNFQLARTQADNISLNDGIIYKGPDSILQSPIKPLNNSGIKVSSEINNHRKQPITGKIRPHKGNDFAAIDKSDAEVVAMLSGRVIKIGYQKKGAGHYIKLYHGTDTQGNRIETAYFHLKEEPNLKIGQSVTAGQTLGIVGMSGEISTGKHVHAEVRVEGKAVKFNIHHTPDLHKGIKFAYSDTVITDNITHYAQATPQQKIYRL